MIFQLLKNRICYALSLNFYYFIILPVLKVELAPPVRPELQVRHYTTFFFLYKIRYYGIFL